MNYKRPVTYLLPKLRGIILIIEVRVKDPGKVRDIPLWRIAITRQKSRSREKRCVILSLQQVHPVLCVLELCTFLQQPLWGSWCWELWNRELSSWQSRSIIRDNRAPWHLAGGLGRWDGRCQRLCGRKRTWRPLETCDMRGRCYSCHCRCVHRATPEGGGWVCVPALLGCGWPFSGQGYVIHIFRGAGEDRCSRRSHLWHSDSRFVCWWWQWGFCGSLKGGSFGGEAQVGVAGGLCRLRCRPRGCRGSDMDGLRVGHSARAHMHRGGDRLCGHGGGCGRGLGEGSSWRGIHTQGWDLGLERNNTVGWEERNETEQNPSRRTLHMTLHRQEAVSLSGF